MTSFNKRKADLFSLPQDTAVSESCFGQNRRIIVDNSVPLPQILGHMRQRIIEKDVRDLYKE